VLEGDVAEGQIGGVRRQIERVAVRHVARAEAVDLAEAADRLDAPFEKAGVEVACDDRCVLTRERARHPADARTDLDERLLIGGPTFGVGGAQSEHREIGRDLGVTGGDELLERQFAARLVVEHPTGGAHHVVATHLLFAGAARRRPRNELGSAPHDV
jgi:hypothetical protein